MLHAIVALAVLLAGSQDERGIPQDARAAIGAANADWIPSVKAHDAERIAAPYGEDGIFVSATGAVLKGRMAIAQMMRDRFAQTGTLRAGTLTQDDLTRQGTLIYEWGHADLEYQREGAPLQHVRGRYLTVWQKSAAGQWQILRNLSLPE